MAESLSGTITRHSGEGKIYAMPHNEALVGGYFLTPVSRPSVKVTFSSLRSAQGQRPNGKELLMLITFNSPMERFEIFTICRRPPVLQTDANVGVIPIVVRKTEASKVSGYLTSAPR